MCWACCHRCMYHGRLPSRLKDISHSARQSSIFSIRRYISLNPMKDMLMTIDGQSSIAQSPETSHALTFIGSIRTHDYLIILSLPRGFKVTHEVSLWLNSCTLLWRNDVTPLHPLSASSSLPKRRSKASFWHNGGYQDH
jgi:hypothetical protein